MAKVTQVVLVKCKSYQDGRRKFLQNVPITLKDPAEILRYRGNDKRMPETQLTDLHSARYQDDDQDCHDGPGDHQRCGFFEIVRKEQGDTVESDDQECR